MATIKVLTQKAEPAGTIDLDEGIFNCEVRRHLFYDVVRMQLANRRRGTSMTRTRSEVSGGGKKPYKQKGTGRARQGSIRSPHYRGGGVVFGPNGRTYGYKLPKKVRRLALCSALSLRQQSKQLVVLDKLALDEFKTKGFLSVMRALGLENALFVLPELDEKVSVSARNIPSVRVLPAAGLNVYDILRHERLVLTVPAIERIEGRLRS